MTVCEYGERYFMLGSKTDRSSLLEIDERDSPHVFVMESINAMRSHGVHIIVGRWLIEGGPMAILFDLNSAMNRLDEWRADIWSVAGIPSAPADVEMNEAIVFGYLVAWFLGEVRHCVDCQVCSRQREFAILAHFHEWLSSAGLVLCRKRSLDLATVFTTHATILGRYLCAGSTDFYNNLELFDVDYEAGKRGIYHRYCLERAAAHCADAFTTVSHITAYEAECLLKRKPGICTRAHAIDGVVPNGLNVNRFSAVHEFQNLHNENKKKIGSFVQGHFYG